MNDSQIKEFKVTHSLFSRLDSGLRKKSFMAWSRATGSPKSLPEHRYKDFLNGQLTESNTYISLISQICTALNIKTYFLLQPHGLSFLQDSNSKLRERYLKDLYVGLATNKEVIDISNQCGMSADDFIDWQHPTTKGYEKIAKTIYKLLQYPNSGLFS